MKIRIMGTREECAAFTKLVRETVPKKNIRSISEFYPNVRKCAYSNEGRVYMDFDGVILDRAEGYDVEQIMEDYPKTFEKLRGHE